MKTKLSSLKIILGFALIFFLSFSHVNSIEYQTSSKHWSLAKNGPTSLQEAVNMFFKNKKLDIYEGVWTESKWGMVAIVKDGANKYKKYVIDVGFSDLNGTHETTYYKTSKMNHLTFYTRITFKVGNSYRFATSTGDLYFKDLSRLERKIDNYAKNPYGTFTRNWPLDVREHNSKVEKNNKQKIEKPKVEKVEKPKKEKKVYDPLTQNDRNSFKDYWWVLIILGLGAFFLYTTTVKKPLRKFNKVKTSKKTEGRIAKYWAGKDTLAFSFWGICFLLLGALYIPLIILADAADNMSGFFLLVSVLYVVFFFVAAVVAYVGCWRSAGFYIKMKLKKKSSAFWGYATYVYLSISVLRSVFAFFKEF